MSCNPLNVVKTSVYYLLNAKNPTPAKREEHLSRIERHVIAADGVITSLSSFARMPLPELRPISLLSCVQDVLELTPLPDNIETVVDVPATVSPVLADPGQIRIVVGNLIRNSREAMPQGGRLTISARPAGDAVELDVADTGVGIAEKDLARVLEPLYSTKARGLGLGLAIARAILEKNRGSLRVASVAGHGSTFTVRLTAAR